METSRSNETIGEEKDKSPSLLTSISFGMGDLLLVLFSGVFGTYYSIFYETEIGMNMWILTFAYVLYAIFNAINDPIIGYISDKPEKLWKKGTLNCTWWNTTYI
jgi:glycoside/pentoside/hexuronide:cation symporter, GPH family